MPSLRIDRLRGHRLICVDVENRKIEEECARDRRGGGADERGNRFRSGRRRTPAFRHGGDDLNEGDSAPMSGYQPTEFALEFRAHMDAWCAGMCESPPMWAHWADGIHPEVRDVASGPGTGEKVWVKSHESYAMQKCANLMFRPGRAKEFDQEGIVIGADRLLRSIPASAKRLGMASCAEHGAQLDSRIARCAGGVGIVTSWRTARRRWDPGGGRIRRRRAEG